MSSALHQRSPLLSQRSHQWRRCAPPRPPPSMPKRSPHLRSLMPTSLRRAANWRHSPTAQERGAVTLRCAPSVHARLSAQISPPASSDSRQSGPPSPQMAPTKILPRLRTFSSSLRPLRAMLPPVSPLRHESSLRQSPAPPPPGQPLERASVPPVRQRRRQRHSPVD